MNNPNNHEERIKKLEQNRDELLRIAQRNKLDLQEIKVHAERIELTQGDTNERFDALEQTFKHELKAVFDGLVEHVDGATGEIKTMLADHSERLDHTMATKDDIAALKTAQDEQGQRQDRMQSKLDQILQLLQQKPEN